VCWRQGVLPDSVTGELGRYSHMLSQGNPRDLGVGDLLAHQNIANMYKDRK